MFSRDKKVIYITKTEIEGVLVSGGSSPKIKARYKFSWTSESLESYLKQILDKLFNKNILLLLGEDISYVIKVALPQDIDVKDERNAVYEKIRQEIPETLEDGEWDYKDYGIKDKENQIIAFAPVKDVFQNISDAFNQLNCQVDAIEPVQVSKLRNPDPIIGIALKTDIKRDDEKTFSLQLFGKKIESNPSLNQESIGKESVFTRNAVENNKPKVRKIYPLMLLVVFLLGGIVISGIYYYRTTISKPPKQSRELVISPTITPTSSPTLELSEIKTSILNGSGVEGQATYVSDLLKEAGFEEIETGNAEKYDYANTEVQIKESSSSAILEERLKDILSEYKIEFKNSLQDTSDFDLIITVGQKNE